MSQTSRSLRPWLTLVRPANCLTAVADIAAGWAIAGAPGFGSLALLAGASVCLYAGGVTLNDVCDAAEDARLRPERPIPSGQVSLISARVLAVLLLACGFSFALAAGVVTIGPQHGGWGAPGLIATGLVVMIILYNAVLKRWALPAAASMGACRGLNLLLGVSAAPTALAVWWPAALGHLVYIAGVTLMARRESARGADTQRRTGVIAAILATLLVALGWLIAGVARPTRIVAPLAVGLLLFIAALAPRLLAALREPTTARVRAAVGRGVLGVALLDGAIAAGFAGWAYGLSIAIVVPLTAWIGRRFTVT